MGPSRLAAGNERGSVLIATLLFAGVLALVARVAAEEAHLAALDLASRGEVLCARFAARAAMASARAGLEGMDLRAVDPRIRDVSLRFTPSGPNGCIRKATAGCGRAVASFTLVQPGTGNCGAARGPDRTQSPNSGRLAANASRQGSWGCEIPGCG